MICDIVCRACKLGDGVTVPAYGPLKPKLIVVCDFPSSPETKVRTPLQGRAGQLMRRALTSVVGLQVDKDVVFTYALKCDPKGEEFGARELRSCKKWIQRELDKIDCKLVLIAGETARELLLPNTTGPINKIHGQVFSEPLTGYRYMVTFGPSYVEQFSSFDLQGNRDCKFGSVPDLFLKDLVKLKALIR